MNWIIGKSDKVLITGAAGFVGSKVVETLLSYGFENLRCFVKPTSRLNSLESILANPAAPNVEIFRGNLLSAEDCREAVKDVTVIFHLAAGVDKTYPGCFLNSVVATRNLLGAVAAEGSIRRFVNTSSIAVYSNEKISRRGPMDECCEVERNVLERHEPYTYGKIKQDELLLAFASEHYMPYVIVRPSVVFGPGKAKITDRIGSDTFGVFLHLGLGNTIPLTYIDNCAEAIALAGLKEGIDGQVFNVVDDDLPVSREFLSLYKRKVRRFLSIPIPYRIWLFFNYLWERYSDWSRGQLPPVFNRRSCAVYWKGNTYPNTKAKKLLGWQPKVPMSEALDRFFAYMRDRTNGNA